jgi:zinc protease
MQNLTMDDLKQWLAGPLANGYLEVTLVGDVEPQQALEAIAKTLGALPKRDAAKPAFTNERVLHYPTAQTKDFEFSSQTPCAISIVCWPTAGNRDIAQDHRTRMLVEILRDRLRLKVRTELGATYTPAVARYTSDAFPDFGYVQAELTVDPEKAREIAPLVTSIGAELATGHISDDEFQRAIKPVLASLEEAAKDNGYWLRTLCDCQEHPQSLDEARHEAEDYKSITKAEIEALAKQRLATDKATVINLIPASQN